MDRVAITPPQEINKFKLICFSPALHRTTFFCAAQVISQDIDLFKMNAFLNQNLIVLRQLARKGGQGHLVHNPGSLRTKVRRV